MVWTNAQKTTFLTDKDHLHIPQATVEKLKEEGIEAPEDLLEFDEEKICNIAKTFRANNTILGAKSIGRLCEACNIVKYYKTVNRTLTTANMRYNQVIQNFAIEWKALIEKKEKDEPATPKLTKGVTVMQWSESFSDILHRIIGVRHVPLAYVIRDDAKVPETKDVPEAEKDQPWAKEYGCIETELISLTDHAHALFRQDNADVYAKMEEATRNTTYWASIKPFQRTQDGCGAYLALVTQFAGKDKWEKEIQQQSSILHTRKWKGQNNFTLERHVGVHQNAYVMMEAGSVHVNFQLPNEHT